MQEPSEQTPNQTPKRSVGTGQAENTAPETYTQKPKTALIAGIGVVIIIVIAGFAYGSRSTTNTSNGNTNESQTNTTGTPNTVPLPGNNEGAAPIIPSENITNQNTNDLPGANADNTAAPIAPSTPAIYETPSGTVPLPGANAEGEIAPIAANPVREFTVTGKNFEFSTKEIRIKVGDRVRINFSSSSGFHDWVIDAFNAATEQVNTGNSASVEFVASKAGTFEYYCSVGSHRSLGMVGNLIVE